MEKYTNSDNLEFYKKSIEQNEYKIIDKFFRFWITRSFILHFVNWTKLHKTFLNDKNEFDEEKYEAVLNFLIVQDIFTKNKTIRYDTIWDILDRDYIEWIFLQNNDTYKIFWESRFTEELSEFNFSELEKTNMWDFDVLLTSDITDEELAIVDKWLEKYLKKLYYDLVDLLVDNKENKDLLEVTNEVASHISRIILKTRY